MRQSDKNLIEDLLKDEEELAHEEFKVGQLTQQEHDIIRCQIEFMRWLHEIA